MLGTRKRETTPTPTPPPPAVDQCAEIEVQIAETNRAIAVAKAQVDAAGTAEELAKARSEVDFAEVRAKALTEQRVNLEVARLEEVAAAAVKRSTEAGNRSSELARRFEQLRIDVDRAETAYRVALHESSELFRDRHAAVVASHLHSSTAPVDQANWRAMLQQLRERLTTLGEVYGE